MTYKFLNRLKQITLSLKKATHNNGTYASTLTQTKLIMQQGH